jgi:hypoxanthine phosphoribosyltransferase
MKYPLFVRILQDVLADKTRRTVTQQEVIASCGTLARQVLTCYEPDIVVAIDTGGSMPGELVAEILNIPVVHLLVRRDIAIARKYSLDPIPLRWIMSVYHHFLFQTVKPVVSAKTDVAVSGKRALIVDDSLHTGAIVDIATQYLIRYGIVEKRVATIAYVANRKPDFFVLPKGNYSFPWSKDYNNTNE